MNHFGMILCRGRTGLPIWTKLNTLFVVDISRSCRNLQQTPAPQDFQTSTASPLPTHINPPVQNCTDSPPAHPSTTFNPPTTMTKSNKPSCRSGKQPSDPITTQSTVKLSGNKEKNQTKNRTATAAKKEKMAAADAISSPHVVANKKTVQAVPSNKHFLTVFTNSKKTGNRSRSFVCCFS